jgi:Ca2+-binding RTX toxin-like protein
VRTFSFSATDVSSADTRAGFRYEVDFGDGTTQAVSASAAGSTLDHVYSSSGTFVVKVVAVDKDGGRSAAAETTLTVVAARVQDGTLFVGGTNLADRITLTPTGAAGGVAVSFNGAAYGTYTAIRVVVYGLGGADTIVLLTRKVGKTTYSLTLPAVIDGGTGADTIDARGSSGANVLLGGDGNDTIYGGTGRELLIGGLGADTLRGGDGDDILIGGSTLHDDDLDALAALIAEWRRPADYATRIARLRGQSGGQNGTTFLNAGSAFDDQTTDQLFGESGQDWFLAPLGVEVRDEKNNETVTW